MNASRSLKILLAAPLPPPDHGGIVSWSKIIRREISKDQNISLSFIDTNLRYRSVTNYSMPVRLVGGSAQAIRDTFRVYRSMANNRPDLFHLCTIGGLATLKDILMLRIARHYKVPSVIHYRVGRIPTIAERYPKEWKVTQRAMKLADAVISLDRMTEACIKSFLPDCYVKTLPNMVEIDVIDELCRNSKNMEPKAEDVIKIVFVGHVIPAKGIRELIEACLRLTKYPLLLDLFGPVEEDFKAEIDASARRRDEGKWMRLHGIVSHDDAIRSIKTADIVVLPSYSEGFPAVIMEAMACEKAILSTLVGAVPEMLAIGSDRECGICVPPRDAVKLAAGLSELLDDSEKRKNMASAARQRAIECYSASIGCSQLVELWSRLAR